MRFVVAVITCLALVAACAPKKAEPEPEFKPGEVVQFVLGGRVAQVVKAGCKKESHCVYALRVYTYKDGVPELKVGIFEFEIRRVKTEGIKQ